MAFLALQRRRDAGTRAGSVIRDGNGSASDRNRANGLQLLKTSTALKRTPLYRGVTYEVKSDSASTTAKGRENRGADGSIQAESLAGRRGRH
jgi:hypothetical protein